jgi:signal transduction histidine kinase
MSASQTGDGGARRILVVSARPPEALRLREALGADDAGGWTFSWARSWGEAQGELAQDRPAALLIDLSCEGDALEVLRSARGAAPDLPIVVLAGAESEAGALDALERGANDYILEPELERSGLVCALRHAIRRHGASERPAAQRPSGLGSSPELVTQLAQGLRTPLAAVEQFVSMVADGMAGETTPEQEDYLGLALRNASQLGQLIGDLTEVGRGGDPLSVEVRPIDSGAAVWDVVRALTPMAGELGIPLSADIAKGLPSALADERRVREVVSGLIQSALEVAPAQGSVVVRMDVPDEEAGLILVAVEAAACEGAAREQDASQAEPGASAVGHAIRLELVARQGGTLALHREPGGGTRFEFTLPVFSLEALLRPILTAQGQLLRFYALTRVDVALGSAHAAGRPAESALSAVHESVRRAVLDEAAVVLPRLGPSPSGESFFVVSGADRPGLGEQARRLRSRLDAGLQDRPDLCVTVRSSVEEAPYASDQREAEKCFKQIVDRVHLWMRRLE